MAKFKKEEEVPAYGVDLLAKSEKYAGLKDVLPAIAGSEELITLEEADRRIKEFLEREVQ